MTTPRPEAADHTRAGFSPLQSSLHPLQIGRVKRTLRVCTLLIVLMIFESSPLSGAEVTPQARRLPPAGLTSRDHAYLAQLAPIFERSASPQTPRPSLSHTKELTAMLHQYQRDRHTLHTSTQRTIDAWISPALLDLALETEHFRLSYTLAEPDAIPSDDLDLNGLPDYVERAAQAAEFVWELEVEILGYDAPYLAPETGKMEIAFQDLGAYGYTTCPDAVCSIVIENDFFDFPANDDPEGTAIGATKVTLAHEFKHALQFEASEWVESNWIELDATAMEEIVYPVVNDYLGYINSKGSQVVTPSDRLDKGGSGSYDDALWQHSMRDRFGDDILLSLWQRRTERPDEDMLSSYQAVLAEYGTSLSQHFSNDYMVRNYLTGSRAVPGLELLYADASQLVESPVLTASIPFAGELALKGLSGQFVEVASRGATTYPSILVEGTARAGASLVAVAWDLEGKAQVYPFTLGTGVAALTLPTQWKSLQKVGLVFSNGNTQRLPIRLTVTVD